MKKYVLLFILVFILGIMPVKAADDGYDENPIIFTNDFERPDCYNNKTCVIICQYKTNYKSGNNEYSAIANIFYDTAHKNFLLSWNQPYIYSNDATGKAERFEKYGNWQEILDSKGVYDFGEYKSMNIDNFKCPSNIIIDTYENWAFPSYYSSGNQVCVSSEIETCQSVDDDGVVFGKGSKFISTTNNYNFAYSFISRQAEAILNELETNYLNNIQSGELTSEELNNIITEVMTNNYQKFFNGNAVPQFFFSHPANNRIADELHQRLKAFVKDETQKIEDSVDNGEMEREEADTLIDNFNNFMDTVEDTLPHVFGEFFSGIADDWTDDFIVTNRCDSYLGNPEESGSPAYYLQFVFNIMKYASIVMLFVFTISEYVKAIVSNNQDAIKKATIKSIKRLIIAVIIFFLPILIKFLLTILGAYDPGTCNIN